MVLEDVNRMERLLTGVREISRIDSGAAEEETTAPVDVREIAGRVVEAARRRSRGREFDIGVEGDAALVWVPPARVEQVVENLVDNAASFSPPGGAVRVSVGRTGGEVIIRVCDEGPGIPPEHQERIFDRFFSFRPGEKKGAHAGLGLSIVKAISESHGGSIRVSNLEPRGAGFEVRLPSA
jgi:two-component system sensor histidine kinase ChvG